MQETRTAGLAAERLRTAGYDVTTVIGKTGVVGLLRNGAGPTVMLSADMDALPVEGATGLPYASKIKATDREGTTVPVMHTWAPPSAGPNSPAYRGKPRFTAEEAPRNLTICPYITNTCEAITLLEITAEFFQRTAELIPLIAEKQRK